MKATALVKSLAIITSLLWSFGVAHAQPGMSDGGTRPGVPPSEMRRTIGAVFGVNRDFHSGGFRVVSAPSGGQFNDAVGWGGTVGISARFGIGATSDIVARLAYDSRPGTFRDVTEYPGVSVYQGGTQLQSATTRLVSAITYDLLSVEALYQPELIRLGSGFRLGIAAGPTVGYVVTGRNLQTADIVAPADATFDSEDYITSSDHRSLTYYDGPIPSGNSLWFSLKGGVQAEIAMLRGWEISPGLYYDYGLGSVTSAEAWNLNTLMFQVDFRHAF